MIDIFELNRNLRRISKVQWTADIAEVQWLNELKSGRDSNSGVARERERGIHVFYARSQQSHYTATQNNCAIRLLCFIFRNFAQNKNTRNQSKSLKMSTLEWAWKAAAPFLFRILTINYITKR